MDTFIPIATNIRSMVGTGSLNDMKNTYKENTTGMYLFEPLVTETEHYLCGFCTADRTIFTVKIHVHSDVKEYQCNCAIAKELKSPEHNIVQAYKSIYGDVFQLYHRGDNYSVTFKDGQRYTHLTLMLYSSVYECKASRTSFEQGVLQTISNIRTALNKKYTP